MSALTTPLYPRMVARLLALLMLVSLALAQSGAFAQTRPQYSQAELDRMLAPIALYPDPLLSQILMAATYPIEVVEAARWSRANPGPQGDDAVRAVEDKDWDPSVKSLVAFPNVLARMDENLEWTRQLGDAFLEQEPHVMETIQQLRQRARAAGTLVPDERIRVVEDGRNIVVVPVDPSVVYVPYYDPRIVYGTWWWPAYPPVVWAPWPGYVVHAPYPRSRVGAGFFWGPAVHVSIGFFFGGVDWHQHHVSVVHVHNYYYRPTVVRRAVHVRQPVVVAPGRWQHDPRHRRGVAYRDPNVQQRFAPGAPPREVRRDARGQEQRRVEPRQEQRGAAPAAPRVEPRAPSVARPEPSSPPAGRVDRREAPPGTRAEERREAPRQERPQGEVRPETGAPRAAAPPAARPAPAPRAVPPSSAPRAAPPLSEAPRAATPSPAAPRVAAPSPEAPRFAPPPPAAPRAAPPSPEAPRVAPPLPAAPRAVVPAAPRVAAPSPETPRVAIPSPEAPRAVPPSPATPRVASPSAAVPRAAIPSREAPRAAPPSPAAPRAAPPSPAAPRAAPPSPAVREQLRRDAGGAPAQRAQPQQRENRREQPRGQRRDERS